jgi:hypothetical protein
VLPQFTLPQFARLGPWEGKGAGSGAVKNDIIVVTRRYRKHLQRSKAMCISAVEGARALSAFRQGERENVTLRFHGMACDTTASSRAFSKYTFAQSASASRARADEVDVVNQQIT